MSKAGRNLFATCIERLGNADILVNNAGIWLSGYVTEITQQEWGQRDERQPEGGFPPEPDVCQPLPGERSGRPAF
ncbi:3-oxoacyl-ACP reductase [Klebsiella michiganensis]|uniref:3-oxoacyl-ACP reductase n=1 Tax=Klebsiella michiganensis TaxID=1134687 RepID=A0A7H4MZ01_9ENTR|nr:3-oxoacyl-ACP reductase [Klebsiella michiganensis]